MLSKDTNATEVPQINTVVCFLVINKIELLPEIAIASMRAVTNSQVYIGFINSEDIQNIPKISGVTYVNLSTEKSAGQLNKYQDFTQKEFYSLVQYKWILLQRVLTLSSASNVIYVDLDVLWIRNPIPSVENLFENSNYLLAIQDFTKDISSPNLCMGFVAFKNSPTTFKLLEEASLLHSRMLEVNDKVGDDDVITEMYGLSTWREFIYLLPQATFPVGNLANLFSKKNFYPGLSFIKPYIFHANYVIGNRRKVEFMLLMANTFGVKIDLPTTFAVKIFVNIRLKRLKYLFISLGSRFLD